MTQCLILQKIEQDFGLAVNLISILFELVANSWSRQLYARLILSWNLKAWLAVGRPTFMVMLFNLIIQGAIL